MEFFQICLVVAACLCSLVAGFLFAFAVVVMPGIKGLDDKAFIRSFQAMDGIIQKNQPIFGMVWLGSIVAILLTVGLGVKHLDSPERVLLLASTVLYLLGVQMPTLAINVPLNNTLQALRVDDTDETAQQAARAAFESRWNRSNIIRTCLAVLTSVLLIVVALRY